MNKTIQNYKGTDNIRRWEFFINGYCLVLLNEQAPQPYSAQLLVFKDLELIWILEPKLGVDRDYIQNVYIQDDQLWTGAFSGLAFAFDLASGELIRERFIK